jgi:hypothetical protein
MKKLLLLILFLLPLQTFASGGHGEGDAYSILLNIGLLFLVGFIAMIILIEIILN